MVPYKRVSDNLQTGPSGGSISSNQTVSFGVSILGNATGLSISTSISISNKTEYTLKVGPNRRVYMGYRVLYKVETGTNECYDIVTGRIISSSKYTAKTPQHGEYGLVNY